MEVASGVNIFVTETAANKLSGEDNQTEDGMYEVQHKEEALDCRNQKQHPREGPKSDFTKIFWIKLGPTKKRVQIEIVAELENLSWGVTKQKNWKQMVTHGSKLALKLEISVDIHGIRDGPKAPSLGDLDFCARAVVASNSVDYEFPCQELENESVASSPIL
ncbi:hypothetical protein ACS0TY_029597 [Phlomoides rotata]